MARDNLLYDILQVWPNINSEELEKYYKSIAVKLCFEQVKLKFSTFYLELLIFLIIVLFFSNI